MIIDTKTLKEIEDFIGYSCEASVNVLPDGQCELTVLITVPVCRFKRAGFRRKFQYAQLRPPAREACLNIFKNKALNFFEAQIRAEKAEEYVA
jgi:hypothetical protein